jgi:hypothetical protein
MFSRGGIGSPRFFYWRGARFLIPSYQMRLPCLLLLIAVSSNAAESAGNALSFPKNGSIGFSLVPPQASGILFTNVLSENRSLTNQIYLNGSGVAAGDIDGDGLCDLYFCGLDNRNELYRNLGNWSFTRITEAAGVACSDQASTGAVFADIDGDGNLDLLVNGCRARDPLVLKRRPWPFYRGHRPIRIAFGNRRYLPRAGRY